MLKNLVSLVFAGLLGVALASEQHPRAITDDAKLNDAAGTGVAGLPYGFSVRSDEESLGAGSVSTLIWDNVGFVTHPGAGVDGADVSMASEDHNSAGDNVRKWEDNPYFRIADRFEVQERAVLTKIWTLGYEPFEFPPDWSTGSMRLWRGFPDGDSSQLVFEKHYEVFEFEFTNAYRILHLADLDDVRRPIFNIGWSLSENDLEKGPLVVEEGEYWIDWQVVGGETGWSLRVMEANPVDPDYPVTVQGSAHQYRPVGWAPTELSTPFQVLGYTDQVFADRLQPLE